MASFKKYNNGTDIFMFLNNSTFSLLFSLHHMMTLRNALRLLEISWNPAELDELMML